jgi:hypothetical protein
MWFVGEENVMGRKKIVDVGWEEIGADMDRVDGDGRRKEEEKRVSEAVEKHKAKSDITGDRLKKKKSQ